MYGIDRLKPFVKPENDSVICPVNGCTNKVQRMKRKDNPKDPQFLCPAHSIFISPTTFIYQDYKENLLWKDEKDLLLLASIFKQKRERRMGSDNSEDALTWNVFRYLEKEDLLHDFISNTVDLKLTDPDLVYWSYSQKERELLGILGSARENFELVPSKGSEPDLIINDDNWLIFIESKFTAGNKTQPTAKKPDPADSPDSESAYARVKNMYVESEGNWWDQVFNNNFDSICDQDKKYELARFWLLGTWMAKQMNKSFCLINLVREGQEEDIANVFGKHIIQDKQRFFKRMTWEQIRDFIFEEAPQSVNRDIILAYFENKTIGYTGNGMLQRAFQTK